MSSQSQGVDKNNKERRRLESAGTASATGNQIQLSPTDQPVAYCLLLLMTCACV